YLEPWRGFHDSHWSGPNRRASRGRLRGSRPSPGRRPCHASPYEVSMVSPMPRTVEEILAHADELATRFEYYEPNPADEVADEADAALRGAVGERSTAERHVRDAVQEARAARMSGAKSGHIVGTSGEAVRQRYGNKSA